MKDTAVTKTRLIDTLKSFGCDPITNSDIQAAIAFIRGTTVQPLSVYCMALYGTYRPASSWAPACNDGYWTRPSVREPRYLRKVGRGKWIIAE